MTIDKTRGYRWALSETTRTAHRIAYFMPDPPNIQRVAIKTNCGVQLSVAVCDQYRRRPLYRIVCSRCDNV